MLPSKGTVKASHHLDAPGTWRSGPNLWGYGAWHAGYMGILSGLTKSTEDPSVVGASCFCNFVSFLRRKVQ